MYINSYFCNYIYKLEFKNVLLNFQARSGLLTIYPGPHKLIGMKGGSYDYAGMQWHNIELHLCCCCSRYITHEGSPHNVLYSSSYCYTLGWIDNKYMLLGIFEGTDSTPPFTEHVHAHEEQWYLGSLQKSRKVPVEAQFKTRSCLNILCWQTQGKYRDGGFGLCLRREGRKLKNRNPENETNLSNGAIQ